ncbi:MAG: DUF1476 domain-containing protein [Beijerinckiaceae bacterium]
MTTFDKREQGYEAKLAQDEELKFKATVRRNTRLGQWAAEKLGKTGADAEAYATALVSIEIKENGDESVFRRIRADFDAAGVAQSDHQIRRHMDELLAQATKEIVRDRADTKKEPGL